MNKTDILAYFSRLDKRLDTPSVLHIYGSAAVILLGADDRTSLDIDVAGPYSTVNDAQFAEASAAAGLPVNPAPDVASNHLEWVGALRLCLPPPPPEAESLVLWRGANLLVKTGKVEDLVASKLIRYDETDQADIQFLAKTSRFTFESVAASVKALPRPFDTDILVLENLANLKADLAAWEGRT
ncbi:MAG: hypothetical protein FWG50_00010 [Kiritimatiellaeota bacterium]|nr:hypothetical protein [Kiritimatiellota bacterium]